MKDLQDQTIEELKALIQEAQQEINNRHESRRKELWGNIVSAIKKYEEEIGDIQVIIPKLDYDDDPFFCLDSVHDLVVPGEFIFE